MKTTPELRDSLGQVSSALARIHKTLLENEIEDLEVKLNIKMSPADRLNALLNDPALHWLRAMSQLMASVDEVYFQKEPIEETQWQAAIKSVDDLFAIANESEFAKRYRSLLPRVPDLMPQHGLLRAALTAKKTTGA